jgi:hypothetical protein
MLDLVNLRARVGQRLVQHLPHLTAVRLQNSTKLYPSWHTMSTIAFRAMREDGSGMEELDP